MMMKNIKIDQAISLILAKKLIEAEQLLIAIKPDIYQVIHQHHYCVLQSDVPISTDDAKDVFWFIQNQLFVTVPQNANNQLIVEVKTLPQGNENIRYTNNTNGFNFHSDGSYIDGVPPTFMSLACIAQADVGGDSILIDVQSLFVELAQKPALFQVLTESVFYFKLHWDKKNEIIERKILDFNADGSLNRVNYFREVIEAGHQIANQPLTTEQTAALNYLDMLFFKHIGDIRFRMKQGDFLIVDNHKMLHGRMPFKEQAHKRHLLRMWGERETVE